MISVVGSARCADRTPQRGVPTDSRTCWTKCGARNVRSISARALNSRAELGASEFARLYQLLWAALRDRFSRSAYKARRVGLCGITLSEIDSGRVKCTAILPK